MNPTPDTDFLWLSISALAAQKGITRQSVSERVARLEADGRIKTRRGAGRTKLINLVEFDRVIGETADLSKEQAARTVKAAAMAPDWQANADPSFTELQKKKAAYDAGIRALDYAARRGSVLPIAGAGGVDEAMKVAAERMVRAMNALPNQAPPDERPRWKTIVRQIRDVIGRELRLLQAEGQAIEAAGGMEIDVPIPDEGQNL